MTVIQIVSHVILFVKFHYNENRFKGNGEKVIGSLRLQDSADLLAE